MMILMYFYRMIAILIGMVLHEYSHGVVSSLLGDPTPREQGRLSLNPLRHIDPVGAIMILLAGFGWAKPVSVDPRYYKNRKVGMALTAFAGPFMNFLIAIVAVFVSKRLLPNTYFFQVLASINIGLLVFNLIPFPPLDGSKILAMVLPSNIYDKYIYVERYGFILLGIMVILGSFTGILSIGMQWVYTFIYNIV